MSPISRGFIGRRRYTTDLALADVTNGEPSADEYESEPPDPEDGGPAQLPAPQLYLWTHVHAR